MHAWPAAWPEQSCPQLPQFAAPERSVSQPSPGLPLQSPQPWSQAMITQLAPWQPTVACGTGGQAPLSIWPLQSSSRPLQTSGLGWPGTQVSSPTTHWTIRAHAPTPQLSVVPGVQVCAWHTPPAQIPLTQSLPLAHFCPLAHFGQFGPPQSMSVSPSFWIPSEHVGAGSTQTPAVHTPVTQSVPLPHFLPSAHFGQFGPPQSTSVSCPFWTPSEQVAAAASATQAPSAQCEPPAHAFPHAPQLAGSDASATHAPAHAVRPESQTVVHWPLEQT